MELIDTRHIYYFTVIAKHLNYTKAAETLFISQSSLSRQIMDLEEKLGVSLFIRDKRQVKLTPAGEELYQSGVKIIKDLESAIERTRMAGQGTNGNIRFGSSDFNNRELISVVQSFKNINKNITITMKSFLLGTVTDELLENHIDLGYTTQFAVSQVPFVDFLPFTEEEFGILVTDNSALAKHDYIEYQDLKNEKFVFYDDAGYRYLTDLCLQMGFNPNINHLISKPLSLNELLLQIEFNTSITFVPLNTVFQSLPGVKILRFRENAPKIQMGFVWKKDTKNVVVHNFLEYIRSNL
ncbi:MAG: LysR family transcriptional regulator [Agathobacter sp.]